MIDKIIQSHLQKGELRKALDILEEMINKGAQDLEIFLYLGKIYFELNDYKKSIFYYKKCNQIKPNTPKILYNLALVFQGLGRIDEAKKIYHKLILVNPNNIRSYYGLFNLDIKNINSEHQEKLKVLANDERLSLYEKSLINFIFSKLAKKRKKFKEEIKYLDLSHQQSFKSNYKFNIQAEFYYKKIIKYHYNQISCEGNLKDSDSLGKLKPIFIIGLPRSGSTLVESLITQSSEKIHSFGESHTINMSIFDTIAYEIYSENFDYKNFKFKINQEKFQNSLLERYGNFNDKIFIDKSLENFFNIDIILNFFPQAKFLHTYRDFKDSIIGIYQRMMPDLSWSHSIENILNYANNYKNVIEYFKKKYPNNILDINLENLTREKEVESKKIFDFCNINWSKDVLDFNKNKRLFTKTNSFLQIRDKIDYKNINKYESYYYLIDV